jgi:hypothetical protein
MCETRYNRLSQLETRHSRRWFPQLVGRLLVGRVRLLVAQVNSQLR